MCKELKERCSGGDCRVLRGCAEGCVCNLKKTDDGPSTSSGTEGDEVLEPEVKLTLEDIARYYNVPIQKVFIPTEKDMDELFDVGKKLKVKGGVSDSEQRPMNDYEKNKHIYDRLDELIRYIEDDLIGEHPKKDFIDDAIKKYAEAYHELKLRIDGEVIGSARTDSEK